MSNLPLRFLSVLVSCGAALGASAQAHPPAAPVHEVVDSYFGREVRDPYRYMEEGTPEALRWMKEQAATTERVLAARPERSAIHERLRQLENEMGPRFQWVSRLPGERYLYSKSSPQDDVYKLYVREGLNGRERLLVDPERYHTPGGPPASMQAVYQSRDGERIAYVISIGNSERATLHVLETKTGREIEPPIDNVFSFASIDWPEDGNSFFYRKLPALAAGATSGERYLNSSVFHHVIGRPSSHDELIAGPAPNATLRTQPTHWTSVNVPASSSWAVAVVSDGIRNEKRLFVAPQAKAASPDCKWRPLADFEDGITDFAIHGDVIYYISQKGISRGRVLKADLSDGTLAKAEVVIGEPTAAPVGIAAPRDALYVVLRDGVDGRLFRVPYGSGKAETVPLPADGIPESYWTDSAGRMDGILFTVHGWTHAPLIYSIRNGSVADTHLRPLSKAEQQAALEVTRAEAIGHDGVKVPITIVHKRGMRRSGDNLFYVDGYGSYGASVDPSFDTFLLAWYERGGALAVAHVRGGGEFGEEWHRAGMKSRKPNTWLDYIACVQYLIREKYTRPERIVGHGVSAGGILIGRAITERPELFGAALIAAGTNDMVRGEFQKNGPVNVPEFGTVKSADDFPWLFEMSAYHHVKDRAKFPAVLVTTGWNDPVVDPWQSAKMAARLQAATASTRPVLLRMDDGGHDQWGSTRTQLRALRADQLTFMLWQVGNH